jgi:CheY-like chemotaxis protein
MGRSTVLHVDDNEDFLDVSRTAFERRTADGAVDIESVATAEAGLDRLRRGEVDCLVSDSIRLPDGDPLVAVARRVAPEVPVVVFTGAERANHVALGDAYVRKGGSDDFARVATAVRELLTTDPIGDDWTLVGRHSWTAPVELATTIARSVAAHLDRDVLDLPPLYESIEPEALCTLLDPTGAGPDPESERDPMGTRVRFSYAGVEVLVTEGGHVGVR